MRSIARIAVGTVIAIVLMYAADIGRVELLMAAHHDPTSAVQVRVMLAVPQKSGRIEYTPGGIETQTCVRSMFPQLGLEPCWYVSRHTRKQVNF